MSTLPNAEHQCPACGTCGSETSYAEGDFVCEDCQLCYHGDDLIPSFLDPDAKACGAPCDNTWHGDHKIRPGYGYDCSPCKLPAGHDSLHWTGCDAKTLTENTPNHNGVSNALTCVYSTVAVTDPAQKHSDLHEHA